MTLTTFEKQRDADVLVVGAGPVGLMLACELKLGGASVIVLERLTEIDQTVKAGSLNTAAVEALYRRGLLPEVLEQQQRMQQQFLAFRRQRHPQAAGASAPAASAPAASGPSASGPASATTQAPKLAGHFGGRWLNADLVDGSDPDFAAPGPAAAGAMITQQALEELLGRHAARLGVEIRRGVELTGFEADHEGVTVSAGGELIRAGWLAGCDGGRSLVRRLAGFEFPGTGPEITGHQAVVELTGSEALKPGWNLTDQGVYVFGPAPGRILTVEFDGPPEDREAPVTAAELQASLRHVSGADVTVTAVLSATRYTDNARQATSYRAGRVLLAGDAAHVHSPFGGQGLNLGLGDAMNLGWKLAAVARGRAPESLLDTYTAERHPIGAWVLDWTRAQVALMRPEPRARALRAVVSDLMETVSGTTYFVKQISGLWQHYDLAASFDPADGHDLGGGHDLAASHDLGGGHELTGRSAPDLALSDGTRLADHLHDGRGLLLDLAGDPDLRARARAGDWPDQVRVLEARCADRPGLSALLVRPDGFVAWAADADHVDTRTALDAALTSWFGAPCCAAVTS